VIDYFKTYRLAIVIVLLTAALLRIPSLEQPFDNDCGANAYHARLITRGEPLYSTHHPAHQLPAIYYTYALAFALLGDSVWSVKAFLILWTVLTVALVYRLGRLTLGHAEGLLGALFYSVLSSHVFLFGTTAQNELFANLPRMAAVYFLVRGQIDDVSPRQHALAGFFSAVAFLFRASYLSSLFLAFFLWVMASPWQPKSRRYDHLVTQCMSLAIGFCSGLLPVFAYFGSQGLLRRFLLVFQLGVRYVKARGDTGVPVLRWFCGPFVALAFNNVVLLSFSLLAAIRIVVEVLFHEHEEERSAVSYGPSSMVIWFFLSVLVTLVSKAGFLHYFLLIVPSLSLLAARFVIRMYQDLSLRLASNSSAVARSALAIALIMALGLSTRQNARYYSSYLRYKIGRGTFEEFLLEGWPALGRILLRVQVVADYVSVRTTPLDLIYVWSDDVQLYYLADRRCAIDTIWPLSVEATGSYRRVFVPETKYIIVGEGDDLPQAAWLSESLAKDYVLEAVVQGQKIYRRVSN